MDSGIAALLGAIIGGIFSIVASLYAHRKTQSSEHNQWLRDKKAEIYSNLLHISREILAVEAEEASQAIDRFAFNLFDLMIFTADPGWAYIEDSFRPIIESRDGGTLDDAQLKKLAIELQGAIVIAARKDLAGITAPIDYNKARKNWSIN